MCHSFIRTFNIALVIIIVMLLCNSCKDEKTINKSDSLKGEWVCNDLKDIERYENFKSYILVFGDNYELNSFVVDKNNKIIEDSKGKYFFKNNKISLHGENGSFYNYTLSKDHLILETKDESGEIRLVFVRNQ